jgi:hypothetical protein
MLLTNDQVLELRSQVDRIESAAIACERATDALNNAKNKFSDYLWKLQHEKPAQEAVPLGTCLSPHFRADGGPQHGHIKLPECKNWIASQGSI